MTHEFSQLVRFRASDGIIYFGEVDSTDNLVGKSAQIYEGDSPWNIIRSQKVAQIVEVLCPLPSAPIIYGIGLNYKQHIAEASFPTPDFPVVFTKPNDSLAGPYEDVTVSPKCTEMDYEGELCVVIGKDVKNFEIGDDPLHYVLGYMVGNDLSSRHWQMKKSGGQHGTGKSFDKFAPLGPAI